MILTKITQIVPPTIDNLFSTVDSIIPLISEVIVIASVIMVVYGGAMWMLSEGDAQKIKSAQGTITWAVIGLVFALLIRVFLSAIINFFTA